MPGLPMPGPFADALRRRRARPAAPPVPSAASVRAGLPLGALDGLLDETGLPVETLARLLDVSARTLQRRRAAGEALTHGESDRLWRLLHVLALARRAFGAPEPARAWLTAAHPLLGGESPLDHIDTEPGLREVEDMLTVVDETAAA